MAAPCFIIWNAAAAPTAAPTAQSINASGIRTMLQVAPSSTKKIRIVEWGYSFNAAPSANVLVELVETGTVFASGLTAHVAAGIMNYNDVNGGTSTVQLGTALTGYSAGSATEGTSTADRLLDFQYENGLYFKKQFPLGREPEVNAGAALRIRATGSSAATMLCYVVIEE